MAIWNHLMYTDPYSYMGPSYVPQTHMAIWNHLMYSYMGPSYVPQTHMAIYGSILCTLPK